MYGTGARFLDSLTSASYYIKVIAVFLTACIFVEFIHWVTIQLDRNYDWKENPFLRLILQFSLGMIVPGVIDYFFLSLYQWYFGLTGANEILSRQSAIPVMIIPLFLFNVYYLLYNRLLRKKEDSHSKKDEILLIQQGTKTIPVELGEIRYIYHRERINYLVLLNGTTFFLNDTLEELENSLPKETFFRVNRKMIIHYKACQHFRSNGHGKLTLSLIPPFNEEVSVSQVRAASFRDWIKN